MGILRFFLALNILLFHVPNLSSKLILNSFTSVSIFFIISGFYMSLILNKKYVKQKNANFLFYSNRALRIYPTYLVVLFLFLFLSILKYNFGIGSEDNAITHYLIRISNLAPIEALIYNINFIFRNITLVFTLDYFWNSSKDAGYFLVQQAWTLQLELLFYLFAPFIARKKFTKLTLLTLIYFILKYINAKTNILGFSSLNTQFTEYFVFFLLGIWSYRLFTYVRQLELTAFQTILNMCAGLLFIYIFPFLQDFIPSGFSTANEIIFYIGITISIPFFFIFSEQYAFDSYFADYSYPIYILHFLCIKLINNLSYFQDKALQSLVAVLLLTFFIATLSIKLLEKPIYEYRQSRIKKNN